MNDQPQRWQNWLDKASDTLHVVPVHGRGHDISTTCWCEPRRDETEPRIVIHNFREVA